MGVRVDREQWRTRHGFILAAIGAAVGLGNVWRFAYVAGENGGAAFLIVYVACIALVGAPLMVAEMTLGRRAQGDAVTAFRSAAPGSGWPAVGGVAVAAAFLILSYYSVIAGWAARYFAGAVDGSLWIDAVQGYGVYFERFIGRTLEPVLWQAGLMVATALVVGMGVASGIERINRILLPALGMMVLGLAVHGLTMPGARAGLEFLFSPRWEVLLSPRVYLAALGQAFFSLGIGMAILITYGGYLGGQHRIPLAAGAVAAGDTLFAVLAGIAIFPAVFSVGLDPAAGPPLAFVTLPQIFLAIPGGNFLGVLFFLLLVIAAVTSMVSLLEVPVAWAMHRWRIGRWTAAGVLAVLITATGIPSALSYGALAGWTWNGRPILDNVDFIVSDVFLPLSGLLTAVFVGWRWGRAEALREAGFEHHATATAWLWCLRIVTPTLIALILVQGLLRF